MASSRVVRIGSLASLAATALVAQQFTALTQPKFEVVSIHEVPRDTPPTMRTQDFTPILPGGHYVDSRTTLGMMIAFAWDVDSELHLTGLPSWAQSNSFAVEARSAEDDRVLTPAENRDRVRLMMRAMLADRFRLKLHMETRQERVFKLAVARSGIKVQEVDPPRPPATEGNVNAAIGDRGGRMTGNKSTMAGMAIALTIFLRRPVIDATGLKAYYDFDVRWSAPELPDGQSAPPGLGTEGIGLLMSALQNQFGLQIAGTTGPVKYWVVDAVEPPTEN